MTDNKRTERERVALELVNHERMVEHNLPPIEWCELTEKDQRKYLARSVSAIAALRSAPVDGLVERLEACANDPMWADHAEVSKALLRRAATALRSQGQDEREEIVAWLRERRKVVKGGPDGVIGATMALCADAIDAGQHKGSA